MDHNSQQDGVEGDFENAKKTWEAFTKSTKWTVIGISITVLLLGLIFTDLF